MKICNLKIDVSREASIHFLHISRNATPTMQFAPCRHLTQPWQSDLAKTRNTTRLKCCACHAKWRWMSPKCCACHENRNASSENVAKVLRLPHKTTCDTLWNMLECHSVPRLPRKMRLCGIGNLQKWPLLQNSPLARPYGAHATACERLRTVARRLANTASAPRTPEWNGNPCYAFGKNDNGMPAAATPPALPMARWQPKQLEATRATTMMMTTMMMATMMMMMMATMTILLRWRWQRKMPSAFQTSWNILEHQKC